MLLNSFYVLFRFNSLDQRLQRELEVIAMVMEGLHQAEARVKYDIIGHSGENPEIVFSPRNNPPQNENDRLKILEVRIVLPTQVDKNAR